MSQLVAPTIAAKSVRVRMSPQMRREMILDAAVTYFADHGFEVQIRQIAREIGISPALVFKYFESKDALIEAVYDAVFERRWDDGWEHMIRDRAVPLPDRLEGFYLSYLDKVDERNWIRIAMRASLDGNGLTRRYLSDHVTRLLNFIADELDHWTGRADGLDDAARLEAVWNLHSAIVYYLIRKHIHQTAVLADRRTYVRNLVHSFIPVQAIR